MYGIGQQTLLLSVPRSTFFTSRSAILRLYYNYFLTQSAVSFQKNMTPDSKLRGIFDMRQGWLKELHDRKKFIAVKVATEDNLADNLTKPLDGKTRKRLDGQLEAIKQRVLRSFRGQVSS